MCWSRKEGPQRVANRGYPARERPRYQLGGSKSKGVGLNEAELISCYKAKDCD